MGITAVYLSEEVQVTIKSILDCSAINSKVKPNILKTKMLIE